MSSRLLKKALAASNQLSEGYSPWAKYKLKNPSASTHPDVDDSSSHSRRDDDGEEDHNADAEPKVAPSAGKAGRRASAGARVQAAPVEGREPATAADNDNNEGNNEDDSTVLDDDDLDVTIPLSDTFPGLATTTTTTTTPRRPPPAGQGDDFEGTRANLSKFSLLFVSLGQTNGRTLRVPCRDRVPAGCRVDKGGEAARWRWR
jgi:hypothetical protein